MADVLTKEIIGDPILVAIRGSEYVLAYPMHNVILYKQRTGDSLFDPKSWPMIDLQNDPERWLACLWSGLHQKTDNGWRSPFTIEQLGELVDFSNAGGISVVMVRALTQFMPKAKDGDVDPKTAAPARSGETPTPLISSPSTLAPGAGLDSVGTSS